MLRESEIAASPDHRQECRALRDPRGGLARQLARPAYRSSFIRLGHEPLDLLPRIAAIDPDVILIDLENPSRDTLEQMFQVSRLAKRPIAMFVDQSDSATVQEAIDAGVSAYVVDGLRRERVKSILDVTISRFHAFDRLQRELSEAKSALEDRKVVEQAKAILMKQKRIDEEQAYGLLRRTAMNQNRKIADLARSLVAAAALLASRGARMNKRIVAGFVPLVDCAVLVAAHELGFARRHGIELDLVKEPSWASLRDHLNLGYVDCAHALAPLPIASALGVGHVRVDCAVPFVLGRGGNAITVARQVFDEMCAAAGAIAGAGAEQHRRRARSKCVRRRRTPLTLGMVFPFSTHNFDLRYWLAAAGIHPDQHVRLVAIPPPLMVESLRAGHIDGFCVGEPWNSLAVADGLGRIVATKSQLLPRGVEKVLAVPPAARAPTHARSAPLLHALAEAAAWADDRGNAAQLAQLLAAPRYVGVPASIDRGRLARPARAR